MSSRLANTRACGLGRPLRTRARARLQALRLAASVLLVAGAWVAAPGQTTATSERPVLSFDPVQVGVSNEAAQTLTARFVLSSTDGESRRDFSVPTAALHYGLSFSVGSVTCAERASGTACSVPVTFRPSFPGGRKDALFLSDGSRRIATVLLYGIGKAPLALLQPGIDTTSAPAPAVGASVVDEAGTLFTVNPGISITGISKAGAITTIPVVSSATSIGIDGAGVLYLSERGATSGITYDTVRGVEGVWALPSLPPGDVWLSTAVGNAGMGYALRGSVDQSALPPYLYTVSPGGGYSASALNSPPEPASNAYTTAVDSDEDILIDGGGRLLRVSPSGKQTEVSHGSSGRPLATDAAGTPYTASSAWSMLGKDPSLVTAGEDAGHDLLGLAVGPDGTVLLISGDNQLDVVDRSHGRLDFGQQPSNVFSEPKTVSIYNGGNTPLTISDIQVAGSSFNLRAAEQDNCAIGVVLAAGTSCRVAVSFKSPHAGRFSGQLTFTSNSLNREGRLQAVDLSGSTAGLYVTASPSLVTFAPQAGGTTSDPISVTLTNRGLNPAVLAFPRSTGSFAITPGTCASALPVNASCQFSVTYAPHESVGMETAAITLPLSCSGCDAQGSVTVTAAGTMSVSRAQIIFNPTSLAFGSKPLGSATALPITLTNPGGSPVAIGGIALSGPGAAGFAESTTCGATLQAGASCTIDVTFKPRATGAFSAWVTVFDCGKSFADVIPVSGNGFPAPIVLAINEVLRLADSKPTLVRPTLLMVKEAIHLSDNKPALRPSLLLTIREVVKLSDAKPKIVFPTFLAIREALHLSDGIPKLGLPRILAIKEMIHVSDKTQAKPGTTLRILETLHLSDKIALKTPLTLAVKEVLHLTDSAVNLKVPTTLSIAEVIHTSDHLAAVLPSTLLTVSEVVNLSDSLTLPTPLAINEVLHLSDSIATLAPSTLLAINEALHLTDNTPTVSLPYVLSILESIHTSDGLSQVAPSTVLAINEALHLTDQAPTVSLPYVLSILESIHTSDGLAQFAPSTVLGINEALHLADAAPGLGSPTAIAITELMSLADSPQSGAP